MSSTSSAESADLASASNEPECEPSHSAKSTPIASECCESTGQLPLFTTTCEPLRPLMFPTPRSNKWGLPDSHGSTAAWSMLSAAVSPVRIFRSPERARALAGSAAAYGRSTPELLAKYDPTTSSWRTSQLCLDGALSVFSETWPRSGLMRNGTAYQLPPLVRLTGEIGFGLLPTPSAESYGTNQGGEMGRVGPVRPSLETMARKRLWPTPAARDCRSGRGQQPNGHTPQLAEVLGGSLNPTWVEWLQGFPLGWTEI
jgi:hypothetical protein